MKRYLCFLLLVIPALYAQQKEERIWKPDSALLTQSDIRAMIDSSFNQIDYNKIGIEFDLAGRNLELGRNLFIASLGLELAGVISLMTAATNSDKPYAFFYITSVSGFGCMIGAWVEIGAAGIHLKRTGFVMKKK